MNNADASLTDNDSVSKKDAPKKSKSKKRIPKYDKPHMIIPAEDMDWVVTQTPAIYRLWGECWRCDPYGSRWMQLSTGLKRSAFMQAKKVLEAQGLFVFKPDKSIGDSRETVCWMVQNLHGSRVTSYWKESATIDSKSTMTELKSTKQNLESTLMDSIDVEVESEQCFQEVSVTSQEHFSNSSKEVLKCVDLEEPPTVALLGSAPTVVLSEEEEEEKRLNEIERLKAKAVVDKIKTKKGFKPR